MSRGEFMHRTLRSRLSVKPTGRGYELLRFTDNEWAWFGFLKSFGLADWRKRYPETRAQRIGRWQWCVKFRLRSELLKAGVPLVEGGLTWRRWG